MTARSPRRHVLPPAAGSPRTTTRSRSPASTSSACKAMPAGLRLISAVIFVTVVGAGAAAADCAVSNPATPVVTIEAPPVVYDTSMKRAAIKKREIAVNRRQRSEADIVLGTTETSIQPGATVQIETKPDGNGGFCATVVTLKTVIAWKVVVHVASELKPGSCMYNVVLTHEQGHVDIASGLMPMAKDLIMRAMVSLALRSATGKTPQDAYQALRQAGATTLN